MKLKNICFVIMAAALISFTSCRNEESVDATQTQSDVELNENPKTTAALNPSHGQPGHRCDIPVGAPLDQAATTGNTQQQQPVINSNNNVSPVRMNSSTATPAKNPPHGQPGHDCAVPVGADLR